MARIRSIKPEFPQSEDIGKLSRDARLLFIQLWTIVDDAGRARAASRMLASLLYPYDDDASSLIDGWLDELERGAHIRRYDIDGSQYLEVTKWLKHQKIDRPTQSRLPEYREGSRGPATNSRGLAADLGPRIMDQGPRIKETRARAVSLSDDWPADFEIRFWEFWPNKVGKPAALRALASARKRRCSFAAIMAGIADYIHDKPPDRPWLNPATFLNQNRWEDQPAAIEQKEQPNGRRTIHDAADKLLEHVRALEADQRDLGTEGQGPVPKLPTR